MRLRWDITEADAAKVRALIKTQGDNALVRQRKTLNCAATKSKVTKQRFWQAMAAMRLTSQQNSSPGGPVGRFLARRPFPLSYEAVQSAKDRKRFIASALRQSGGIRFADKIAEELAYNFELLEDAEWPKALAACNTLTKSATRSEEVEAAEYIRNTFKGFGPKQSRNLLQALNLTRYEIPIDSRITDWLNGFGFPVKLTATALADINYYNFVSDGIQELCAKAGVEPCVFDAAVFALRDKDQWTDENIF